MVRSSGWPDWLGTLKAIINSPDQRTVQFPFASNSAGWPNTASRLQIGAITWYITLYQVWYTYGYRTHSCWIWHYFFLKSLLHLTDQMKKCMGLFLLVVIHVLVSLVNGGRCPCRGLLLLLLMMMDEWLWIEETSKYFLANSSDILLFFFLYLTEILLTLGLLHIVASDVHCINTESASKRIWIWSPPLKQKMVKNLNRAPSFLNKIGSNLKS